MNRQLIVIVIMFVLLLLNNNPVSNNVVLSDMPLYEAMGVAFIASNVDEDGSNPPPEPEPVAEECNCKNGKVSGDGGTSWTDCPCSLGYESSNGCKCKHTNTGDESPGEAPKDVEEKDLSAYMPPQESDKMSGVSISEEMQGLPNRIVLLTGERFCAPCRAFKANVRDVLEDGLYKEAGWTIGESPDNSLQVIDVEKNRSLYSLWANKQKSIDGKYNYTVPLLLKIENNKITHYSYYAGSMTIDSFMKFAKDGK